MTDLSQDLISYRRFRVPKSNLYKILFLSDNIVVLDHQFLTYSLCRSFTSFSPALVFLLLLFSASCALASCAHDVSRHRAQQACCSPFDTHDRHDDIDDADARRVVLALTPVIGLPTYSVSLDLNDYLSRSAPSSPSPKLSTITERPQRRQKAFVQQPNSPPLPAKSKSTEHIRDPREFFGNRVPTPSYHSANTRMSSFVPQSAAAMHAEVGSLAKQGLARPGSEEAGEGLYEIGRAHV